ncbi:Plasmodium exported protein, unknown function [Plasmodium gaboni]|uniref:Secreted ookinete protein n=1 Tax=Plasmodium gaboni TaxID=647221 RepID=A0ABY1UQU5_9APIC|nr:Plasmodium exported protein, unknown function [Plasmodium gaboni]
MELFVLVRPVLFITFFYILLNIVHDNLLLIKLMDTYSYTYLWNILKFKNRKILSELSEIQLEDNEIEDFIVKNNVLYSNDFLNIIDPSLFENYDNMNLEEYILNFDHKKEGRSSAENMLICKGALYNHHGDKKLDKLLEIPHDDVSNELSRMISEESSDGVLHQLIDENSKKSSSTLTSEMTEDVKDKISEEIYEKMNDELSEEICDETLEDIYKKLCHMINVRALKKKLKKDKEKMVGSNIKKYYSSKMTQETYKRGYEKCISKEDMEYVINLILEKNKAKSAGVNVSSNVVKVKTRNVRKNKREDIKVVQKKTVKGYSKCEAGKSNVDLIKGLTNKILEKVHNAEMLRKKSKVVVIGNNKIDVYKKGTEYEKETLKIDSDISKMNFEKNSEKSKGKEVEDTKRKKLEQKIAFEDYKKKEERKNCERINKLKENGNNDFFFFNNDYSYLKREDILYSANDHNYKTRLKTKEQRIFEEKEKHNITQPSDYNTFSLSTRKKERPNIIFKENDEYDNTPISIVQMNNSINPLVCSYHNKEILNEGNNETNNSERASFDNIYNDIRKEENVESLGESIFVLNDKRNDERNNEGNNKGNNKGNNEGNNEGNNKGNNEGNNDTNYFEKTSINNVYNDISNEQTFQLIDESIFALNHEINYENNSEGNNDTNHFEKTLIDNVYNDISNEQTFQLINESIFVLNYENNSEGNNEGNDKGEDDTNHFEKTSIDNVYNDISDEQILQLIDESIFVLNGQINSERNNEENDEGNNKGSDEGNNKGNDERDNETNNEVNNEGNVEIHNEDHDEEYDDSDSDDDDYEESLSSSDEWCNDESSEDESDEEMYDYKVSSSELTNLLN